MKDEYKTKAQLIKELGSLRLQIAPPDQPQGKRERPQQSTSGEAHLFYSLASIAASQASNDEILQRCLNIVCEYVGWPVGHLYVEASDGTGELAPTGIWHLDNPEKFEVFRAVTERTRFALGVGLPGRVLSSGEPAWIPDVQQDQNFPRNQQARDIGVRAAFGFPVKIGSKTVAVLEFFTDTSEEPNQHVLDVMRMLGIQFGRVLERRRADEELLEAREELEYRVAERTAELTRANETLGTEITQRRQDVEEKTRYYAYIENSPDFIALAALDGAVLYVNPAGRELVGLESLEEACSKSIPDFLTEEGLKASLEIEQPAVIAHGQWRGESTIRHFKTGVAIPVEIKSFVNRNPDTNEPIGLATVQHDITDRKRAQAELQALFTISSILGQPGTYENKLNDVMQELVRVAEADWATFLVPDPQGGGLRIVTQVGRDVHSLLTVFPPGSGLAFTAMEAGKPVVANDYQSHPDAEPSTIAEGAKSLIALPIKATGETLAVADVSSLEADHFNPDRVRLLTAISEGLGVLLENARLDEQIREELERRQQTEAQLLQRSTELEALFKISSILGQPGTYEHKLRGATQELARVAEAAWATLRVADPHGSRLETYLISISGEGKDSPTLPARQQPSASTIAAMETGKPVVINDYQSHPNAVPSNIAEGAKSVITLPIRGAEETLGVAGVVSREAGHFNPERVRLLTAIADGLGPLLESAKLNGDLLDSNRRLEETLVELRQMQGRMVSQERLRALGTMASGIAHDFNNALGPILGYSDILLTYPDALDDKEKANEYLKTINSAAKDAGAVISRLKEFYRARDDDELTTAVDLNQMVATVISITRPRWRDMAQARGINITVRTQLADDLPTIGGNEPGLRSALTNLIFNAVDAMPEGGDLEISTYLDNDEVVVQVRDTGQGMTEEVLRHAMEPFFTTKGEEGSGLGLAMVHGIIERHEGRVDIESKPGEGTSVIIYLPYRPLPGHPDEPVDESLPRGLRVLVVDDDQRSVDLLSEYLARDGHTVETSRNGREALEKFYQGGIDMVITDRAMPEMGGDELATAIKGIAAGTPVIMLTGTSEDITTPVERSMGIDFFVTKPISITALRQAMAAVWSR